ncbi:YhzD family protein [Oceanobacillus sp. CFH 90083]|uniref:YhzD family protein n=1 Tax=Oceanobacillus sp. CFH 90083 TaxID=2592336 RepID=UPI00128B6054|nr:YhzD family protein [Oceanobacillus sp. CFH 90083]
MGTYYLTVFSKTGEKLLDEHFEASNDSDAKEIGKEKLDKENYSEHTHRCVSPSAKLVLFHR